MKKLLELNKWQSIPDAANYLSNKTRDQYTPADVLLLGMEGHITISVYFPNGKEARKVELIPFSKAVKHFDPLSLKERCSKYGVYLRETERQKKDDFARLTTAEILSDNNAYDLPLIGAEFLDLKKAYSKETDGPEIKQMYPEGTFVKDSMGNLYCLVEQKAPRVYKLIAAKQPPNEYKLIPSMGLGDESVLVVRKEVLEDFSKIQNSRHKFTQTEKARTQRSKDAKENRRIVIEEYEKLKKSTPNITKDEAAKEIDEKKLVPLALSYIRKMLQGYWNPAG
jgi:hypothetical protein